MTPSDTPASAAKGEGERPDPVTGVTNAEAIASWNRRALQPHPSQQVVAWRYRYPNDEAWQLTQDHDQAFKNTGEVEPLGVIPFGSETSQQAGTEAWVEAGNEMARRISALPDAQRFAATEVALPILNLLVALTSEAKG